MATLLAIFAFLASATVLIRYAMGWQRTPPLESLPQAEKSFQHSAAWHAYQHTLSSPAYLQLQHAALRSGNGVTPAWRAFEAAEAHPTKVLNNSAAQRAVNAAIRRPASGAPVAFNHVAQVALLGIVLYLGAALLITAWAGLRALRRGSQNALRFPIALVLGAAALFVLGVIAYEADHKIPPGQPGSEWVVLKCMMLDGQFRFWPVVLLPACILGSILLAAIGGVQLMRRVDMGPRLCRIHGLLAKVTAGFLSLFLSSTLLWVTTLSLQAPAFLTAKDQGILGTPLLPLFLIAVAVMSAATWMVVSGSARCLRNVRSL